VHAEGAQQFNIELGLQMTLREKIEEPEEMDIPAQHFDLASLAHKWEAGMCPPSGVINPKTEVEVHETHEITLKKNEREQVLKSPTLNRCNPLIFRVFRVFRGSVFRISGLKVVQMRWRAPRCRRQEHGNDSALPSIRRDQPHHF